MSEPDAVPLPRDGEVFFDVRGEARSMRLSWYANSRVAVFSIWQGNRCTGTFRLPLADLDRMIRTLQAGPPVPASPGYGPGYTTRQPYDDHRFNDAAPPYQQQSQPDYGTASYPPDPRYDPYAADTGYQPANYTHDTAQGHEPGYGMSDYNPPNYSDPNYGDPGYGEAAYAEPNRPGSHRRPSFSDEYEFPDDQESMPSTAMLSFPSVPARNGPYR